MSSDLRTRTRAAKRQAFVDAARGIVDLGGTDALTMQRVAAELACGVGSIYRYFTSKDELVDAVHDEQVQALESLLAPPLTADGHDGHDGHDGRDGPDDPLARLLALGRTWVRAGRTHPTELRTVRRLVVTDDPAVDGVAVRFADALDAAVATGALAPGDRAARARVLLSAIGDAALVADDEAFGDQLLTCLLVAWGADPAAVAEREGRR
jgi:AcrR family transcriptional regulator